MVTSKRTANRVTEAEELYQYAMLVALLCRQNVREASKLVSRAMAGHLSLAEVNYIGHESIFDADTALGIAAEVMP